MVYFVLFIVVVFVFVFCFFFNNYVRQANCFVSGALINKWLIPVKPRLFSFLTIPILFFFLSVLNTIEACYCFYFLLFIYLHIGPFFYQFVFILPDCLSPRLFTFFISYYNMVLSLTLPVSILYKQICKQI